MSPLLRVAAPQDGQRPLEQGDDRSHPAGITCWSTVATLPAERRRAAELWDSISQQLLATSRTVRDIDVRASRLQTVAAAWEAQGSLITRRRSTPPGHRRVVSAADGEAQRLLQAALACDPGLRLVGHAASWWATVGVAAAEQPDILVLDADRVDDGLTDSVRLLRILSPRTRLLLCATTADVHMLARHLLVDRVVQLPLGEPLATALGALALRAPGPESTP